jgi:CBS domain-containing protein
MQVRDLMTSDPIACIPSDDLQSVASMMVDCDCGAIPVIDPQNQKAIGMITDRDIVCRTVARGEDPLSLKVEEVMSMPIVAVTPEVSLEECLAKMERAQVRRMAVLDERDRLCGIISQADIVRAAPANQTAELLKDVSKSTGHASTPS